MDFSAELKERQNYINKALEQSLPSEGGYQKTVIEAMNYSIRVGGKRLRPIFLMESYKAYAERNGGKADFKRIEPFMCALEMIHTYSLVHDDLPAMDNDELRRGMPTTHKKFGHAMGILAGDSLLNYSMETAVKAFETEESTVKSDNAQWNLRVMKALKVLYNKSGIFGMIGGQTLDVEKNGENLSTDEIDYINDNKTCALIQAPILCGAILGGAPEEELEDLSRMGICIGRAFQIKDDILDITADEAVLGKPVGSDAKNGKSNYAVLCGIEKAEEIVKDYSDEAVSIAKKKGAGEFMEALILSLVDRKF